MSLSTASKLPAPQAPVTNVEASIRKVGNNIALELTTRVVVSQVFRLIMAYLAGLPPTVISIEGIVAFTATAALDLPAGVMADFWGHARTAYLGCVAQIVACLAFFGAVVVYPAYPSIMWGLMIIQALADAIGNACLSGAREAAYKEAIDAASATYPEAERAVIQSRFYALSERYGRVVSIVVPPLSIIAAILLGGVGASHWLALPLAVAWLLVGNGFKSLSNDQPQIGFAVTLPESASSRLRVIAFTLLSVFRGLRQQRPQVLVAMIAYILNFFIFVLVSSYLAIGTIRQMSGTSALPYWVPALVVTLAFSASRMLRSYILPKIAEKSNNLSAIAVGSAVQALTAAIAIVAWGNRGDIKDCAVLVVFTISFNLAAALVGRAAVGELMGAVPSVARASFLSALNCIGIIGHALLCVWLSANGQGIPETFVVLALTLLAGAVVAILAFATTSPTRSEKNEI